jgi:16S rRNA (guanine527-N7)-methyltransferase
MLARCACKWRGTGGRGLGAESVIQSTTTRAWAQRFGLGVLDSTHDALLAYAKLLLTWGQVINLTGAKSVDELVAAHFPDAFAIARGLGGTNGTSAPARVVDVGSGGGLPAVPVALLRPDCSFVLFEPTAKKVAFLRTAIRELGLGERVRVEASRMKLPAATAGSFDAAMSRATFPPDEWLGFAWNLVRPGGQVFYLGSRALVAWPAELELSRQSSYRADRWVAELRRST